MNVYVIKMLRHFLMSLFTKFVWKNLPNTMCTVINPKVPNRLPLLGVRNSLLSLTVCVEMSDLEYLFSIRK